MLQLLLFALLVLVVGMVGIAIGSRDKPPEVRRQRWFKTFSYLGIIALMLGLAAVGGPILTLVGILIALAGAVEIVRVAHATIPIQNRALRRYQSLAMVLYAVLGYGFVQLLRLSHQQDILLLFVVVFTFDGFSQSAGQALGRRQLVPHISPNKTVEGFLGSLTVTLIVGKIAAGWLSIDHGVARSLLIALASLSGDLAASHFKRRHQVKDFSNWIPFHGGILDRFDSLIAAGALCYYIRCCWC